MMQAWIRALFPLSFAVTLSRQAPLRQSLVPRGPCPPLNEILKAHQASAIVHHTPQKPHHLALRDSSASAQAVCCVGV
ncbi:hypothetical protein DFJ73DRAFT_835017 [Zopfochytrium polystomum]|nr:hypothetical protein DFJ73DRAFT_835017 [Zopfochytrium polystomum]